jgi:CHAT domain-containing protein
LVLAGAEAPDAAGPSGGRLTGAALVNLPLGGLELAVLSACETGLGQVERRGEGVLGLQRAFHLAGCRNVVASLWEVGDASTAALMGLFYHYLWGHQKPPLEALRDAQLYLYCNPEQVPLLAKRRGEDFTEVPLPAVKPMDVRPPRPEGKRAPAPQWAGFALSGLGK